MLLNIDEFYDGSRRYVELFDSFANKHSLVGSAAADHICYKCDSIESFEAVRALFESNSSYLHQVMISGRRIAYIKLLRSIPTTLGDICFLELSDQKPDGSQVEGFDHIEVFPTTISYEAFINDLESTEKVLKVVRPHHTTHDIDIGDRFVFRCTEGPLIEKIKSSEM